MPYTFISFTEAYSTTADTLDELKDKVEGPFEGRPVTFEPIREEDTTFSHRVRFGKQVIGWVKEI